MFHWRYLSIRRPMSLTSFAMGQMTTDYTFCQPVATIEIETGRN